MNIDSPRTVTIVGAGIAGNTQALALAQQGFTVEVYDWRTQEEISGDIPPEKQTSGSNAVNIGIFPRVFEELECLGIKKDVIKSHSVPLNGRHFHYIDGKENKQLFVTYGRSTEKGLCEGEVHRSILRNVMNRLLFEAATKYPNVNYHFENKLAHLKLEESSFVLEGGKEIKYDFLIGADGVYSKVAKAIDIDWKEINPKEAIKDPWSYMQFTLRAKGPGDQPVYAVDNGEAIHFWINRDVKDIKFIGLPNQDKTHTLILLTKGEETKKLEELKKVPDLDKISEFFSRIIEKELFPFVSINDDLKNPISSVLWTNRKKWFNNSSTPNVVCTGDAVHSVLFTLGMGAQMAMRDSFNLATMMGNTPNKINEVFKDFNERRILDTNAVIEEILSTSNLPQNLHPAFMYYLYDRVMRGIDFPELKLNESESLFIPFNSYALTTLPEYEVQKRRKWQEEVLIELLKKVPVLYEFVRYLNSETPLDAFIDQNPQVQDTYRQELKPLLDDYLAKVINLRQTDNYRMLFHQKDMIKLFNVNVLGQLG
jgi:kynurenine 3-monooxygenase